LEIFISHNHFNFNGCSELKRREKAKQKAEEKAKKDAEKAAKVSEAQIMHHLTQTGCCCSCEEKGCCLC
jgi:hypothetical protein